jgi:spermidine synthase
MTKICRYLSIIFLGIWAMIAQIILIREFFVIFCGNELIFGIIIGAWLIGVGIGAISAGILSKRLKDDHSLFIYSQIIALIILPLAIFLIRNVRHILQIPIGLMIPFMPTVIMSLLIVIPTTFIIGFCFPLASRIFKNIGTVYILEGFGSFLAGVVFSFLLAGHIDHFTIIFITSILVVLNLALLSKSSNKLICPAFVRQRWIYLLILLLITIAIFNIGLRLDNFSSQLRLKSINPRMQMLKSVDSKYQNIIIAKLQDQLSLLSDGRFLFSFPDEYNQEMFINLLMAQHPHPQTVLLIGSGIAGEIYQILKYPVKRLDYVELDPKLIRITRPYLLEKDRDVLGDKRLSIFFSDGRRFINKTRAKYDLIIVNISDASTAMLNRFYTKEFFAEIKHILKKSGTFTTSISSAVNYIGPDIEKYVGSIYKTLKTAFEYVIVVPGDRNQFFCSMSEGIVSKDATVLEKRFLAKKIKNLYFQPELFRNIFFHARVKFLQESLEKIHVPINTDAQPISYYYNLILWNLFSGSKSINIFRKLSQIDLFKISFIFLGIFLFIRLAYIGIKKESYFGQKRFNSYWAIFTTGFAAMAFEVILIFSFQNIYGYAYEMIGLIIGIFMLGMIIGATFSNNILIKFANLTLILLANEIFIVIFAFTLPFFRVFHIPAIFVAGFLTGMEFPLACRLYSDAQDKIGLTAGMIDGADLVGACLGVVLTGTILVPLLGITRSCFIIGALNLSSVILIFSFYLFQRKLVIK